MTAYVPVGVLCLSVVSVTVAEAPVLPGTTCAGDTLHVENAGIPEQESATAMPNVPPSGDTVTENVYELPRSSVTPLADELRL